MEPPSPRRVLPWRLVPMPPAAAPTPDDTARGSLWLRPAYVFGVWTFIGVFLATRPYVLTFLLGAANAPGTDPRVVVSALIDAWYWALMTWPVFWLAMRFRFSRRSWARVLPLHLAAACVVATSSVAVNFGVAQFVWADDPGTFALYFRNVFYIDLQWYGAMVAVAHLVDYHRRWREREVQTAQLGARLSDARLEALKMQIQPHFLFNTLHSISELVHEDPAAADRMITRLGDLLRRTVDHAGAHEVTLAQEMEFLEAYLDIQQTRFQDTLTVRLHVPEALMDARVPNLILQPLVENAIRHGTAPRGGAGRIEVTAERDGETLRLEVRDNGAGLPPVAPPRAREGVGVRNTRQRLAQLYGAGHRFELANAARGGAVATVVIPYRIGASAGPHAEAER
ncbi:MAG TPA: histidine kinase [Longimicrobium sp.]|nr:histidine kinase [Longimicrobium sp.]